MRHMIVGVFPNDALAEQARKELLESGIPDDSVFIHGAGAPDSDGGAHSHRHDTAKNGSPMQKLFGDLFGVEEDEDEEEDAGSIYAAAVDRGQYLVAAEVEDDLADVVAHVLDDNGALDIGESGRIS